MSIGSKSNPVPTNAVPPKLRTVLTDGKYCARFLSRESIFI